VGLQFIIERPVSDLADSPSVLGKSRRPDELSGHFGSSEIDLARGF
jgi:hypothetical protein